MDAAPQAAGQSYRLRYWRYRRLAEEEQETQREAVAAAYWMREAGAGVPDAVLAPDGSVSLDKNALDAAMSAYRREP